MRVERHPAVGKAMLRIAEASLHFADDVLQQCLQFDHLFLLFVVLRPVRVDVLVRVDVRHFRVDETGKRIERQGLQ